MKLTAGTLYNALDRFSRDGCVQAVGDEVVDGRLRRSYRLTPGGLEVLAEESHRLREDAEGNVHDDDLFFSSLLGLEKVRDRARAERLAAMYPNGIYPGGKRIVHIEAA